MTGILKLSENLGMVAGELVSRTARVFGHRTLDDPEFVDTKTTGNQLIEQGNRLNVITQILALPDSDDMGVRGNRITAPVSAADREKMVRKLTNVWLKSTRKTRGATTGDGLNATLVAERINMGKLHARSVPVGSTSSKNTR